MKYPNVYLGSLVAAALLMASNAMAGDDLVEKGNKHPKKVPDTASTCLMLGGACLVAFAAKSRFKSAAV